MWFAIPAGFAIVGGIIGMISRSNVNKAILKQRKQLEELLKEAKQILDRPQDYAKVHQQLNNRFVNLVGTLQLTQYIKKDGKKHVCFIGPTSSGKSTLVNELFNCKEKVSLGSTTKIKAVCQSQSIVVWDAPGVNKNWSTYNAQNLSFFKDLDLIFVLYTAEPEENQLLMGILEKLGKQFICVRTKCDQWNQQNVKTLDEELQNDRALLKDLCKAQHRVIATGYKMRDEIKSLIK